MDPEVVRKLLIGGNEEGPAPGGPTPISLSAGDMADQGQTGNGSSSPCPSYRALDGSLQDPSVLPEVAIGKVHASLSNARLSWYMAVASNDRRLALRLHTWNAAVAASLMPTLHTAEVAIRNFALRRLIARYGRNWYANEHLHRRLGRSALKESLVKAIDAEKKARRPGQLADYVTNEMSFGFWVNVFTQTFVSDLWTAQLHTINASIPRGLSITDLHEGIEFVRGFRNTVAHHKNIIRRPAVDNHERTLKVLGWVCRHSGDLARQTSNFPAVWAASPIPHDQLPIPTAAN